MPRRATNFTVGNLEPIYDPTWYTAAPQQRATYMRAVRELVLAEWDRQTAAGLDKHGVRLAPIAESTRRHRRSAMGPADPNAPPLQPAHELSRTRSLVDARIVGTKIQVFWKFDPVTNKRWGVILGYHARGAGRLPVRDVFGLSPEAHQRVTQAAFLWWHAFSRGMPVVMPVRPRPSKAARPAAAIQPRYTPKRPPTRPTPHKTSDVTIGGDVFTLSKSSAAELLGAIKSGQFTGFRSYE